MSQPGQRFELEEKFFPTSAQMIHRWFPWTRLLRGFRIAIDFRRMLIALVAVWLWSAGDWVISQQGFAPQSSRGEQPVVIWPTDVPASWTLQSPAIPGQSNPDPAQTGFLNTVQINQVQYFAAPYLRVLSPAVNLLFGSPMMKSPLYLLSILAWGVIISSLFGAAISRMTAVDFARSEEISIRSALQFAGRRVPSYVGAPLIASIGFVVCWGMNAFAGLVASIPFPGDFIVSVFWIFPLLAGLMMTLIGLGIMFGWPLMIAAISTESGDAFDGLSRTYSYLLNRPLYSIFLVVCTLVYGTFLALFVSKMVEITEAMTYASFASGHFGSVHPNEFYRNPVRAPAFLDDLTGGLASTADLQSPARTLRSFWTAILHSVPSAFLFSYFWTMVTIIYFLLRKREDATPLNEVWLPAKMDQGGMPVVGIPAAELRESKPAEPLSSPPADPSTEN